MHQYSPEIARKAQNQTFAKHLGGRSRPDEGRFKSGIVAGSLAELNTGGAASRA